MELWKVEVKHNNILIFFSSGRTVGAALVKIVNKLRIKGMVR